MLEAGIIGPISSACYFPFWYVKSDGKLRFYFVYRKLDQVTKPDCWPLSKPGGDFDELKGSKGFTTLTVFSEYGQIEMEESRKDISTFVTRSWTFQLEFMQIGLMYAPVTLNGMMERILKEFSFANVYLDDAEVFQGQLRSTWNIWWCSLALYPSENYDWKYPNASSQRIT